MSTPDPRRGAPDPRTSRRMAVVAWLRKTHGWIGLWGATLGLLFGFSGFWLNHRAVLRLEPEVARGEAQIAVPDPGPADARTMAAWLQFTLPIDRQATSIRVEPARRVAWAEAPGARPAAPAVDGRAALAGVGLERSRSRERETDPGIAPAAAAASAAASAPAGASPAPAAGASTAASRAPAAPAAPLMQPEHWTITFGGPRSTVQADYWVGNRSVSIRRTDNGLVATLTNLHKGVGMPVGWILLVDTLAGSLVLLSLSGLALWMLTRRRRTLGLLVFGAGFAAVAGLALSHV
jgi:hypothetical protein